MSSRKEKLDEITDRLKEGVSDIFESGKYEEYLKVMSKFHRYSFRNTILIAMQNPDATMVAGFQAWKKNFGRYVKRGEKAITILAPSPYKVKREVEDPADKTVKEDEIVINAFRPAYVFDVSQTEGKPLPELASDIYGAVEGYGDLMKALEEASPVPVNFEKMAGKDGYYSQTAKQIFLRDDMSEAQTVAAAVHEISHAMLHDLDMDNVKESMKERGKDRHTMEVEAESVAYAVSQYFGIETGENSFGYIASWSKDKELPELFSSLETIRSTADTLIQKTEASLDRQKEARGIVPEERLMAVMEPSFYLPSERENER
jgi:hypothetical protein